MTMMVDAIVVVERVGIMEVVRQSVQLRCGRPKTRNDHECR